MCTDWVAKLLTVKGSSLEDTQALRFKQKQHQSSTPALKIYPVSHHRHILGLTLMFIYASGYHGDNFLQEHTQGIKHTHPSSRDRDYWLTSLPQGALLQPCCSTFKKKRKEKGVVAHLCISVAAETEKNSSHQPLGFCKGLYKHKQGLYKHVNG